MVVKYLIVTPTEEHFALVYDIDKGTVTLGGYKTNQEYLLSIMQDELGLKFSDFLPLPSAVNKTKYRTIDNSGLVEVQFYGALSGMRDRGFVVEKVNTIGRAFN